MEMLFFSPTRSGIVLPVMMVPVPIACAAPGLSRAAMLSRLTSDRHRLANGWSAADCGENVSEPGAIDGTHHSGTRPLGM